MMKNLNVRVSEELKEKIKIMKEKHSINISQLIKKTLEDKYKELEKNESQ